MRQQKKFSLLLPKILIDIIHPLSNNPALFSSGTCMSLRSSAFTVLVLSSDAKVRAHVQRVFKDASITTSKDVTTLKRMVTRKRFDAVIVESKAGSAAESAAVLQNIDAASTLVMTGSRAALRKTAQLMQYGEARKDGGHNGGAPHHSLDTYLEHKMEDFVKGMRNGSARNLHPMLISAIERPLIVLALKETHGNQIQAAELLGLNRNTLRKKIQELRISFKRGRAKLSATA